MRRIGVLCDHCLVMENDNPKLDDNRLRDAYVTEQKKRGGERTHSTTHPPKPYGRCKYSFGAYSKHDVVKT